MKKYIFLGKKYNALLTKKPFPNLRQDQKFCVNLNGLVHSPSSSLIYRLHFDPNFHIFNLQYF